MAKITIFFRKSSKKVDFFCFFDTNILPENSFKKRIVSLSKQFRIFVVR